MPVTYEGVIEGVRSATCRASLFTQRFDLHRRFTLEVQCRRRSYAFVRAMRRCFTQRFDLHRRFTTTATASRFHPAQILPPPLIRERGGGSVSTALMIVAQRARNANASPPGRPRADGLGPQRP